MDCVLSLLVLLAAACEYFAGDTLNYAIGMLTVFFLEVFTGIRAYALCNRNIWVLIFVFVLSMVPFATNMVGLHCSEYGLHYLGSVLYHGSGIVRRDDSSVLSIAISREYM